MSDKDKCQEGEWVDAEAIARVAEQIKYRNAHPLYVDLLLEALSDANEIGNDEV